MSVCVRESELVSECVGVGVEVVVGGRSGWVSRGILV